MRSYCFPVCHSVSSTWYMNNRSQLQMATKVVCYLSKAELEIRISSRTATLHVVSAEAAELILQKYEALKAAVVNSNISNNSKKLFYFLGATQIKSKIYLVQVTSASQSELIYPNNMMIHGSCCRLSVSRRGAGFLFYQLEYLQNFFLQSL